jgi:DNA-binding NarL/FixJ family response regulator
MFLHYYSSVYYKFKHYTVLLLCEIIELYNKSTIKVLVIDENHLLANKIAEMISEIKCVQEVLICTNYTSINAVVEKENPAVVLFEIHHSTKNGLAILKEFRLLYPHIKIIVVTNKVSSFYKEECKIIGTDFFIDKSNDFETIPQLLGSFCK